MGITVLCLYPTPKGRNPPSILYKKPGFTKCITENKMRNRKIVIFNLWTLTNPFIFGNIIL